MQDAPFDELSAAIVADPVLAGAIVPLVVGLVLAASVRAVARRRIAALAMLAALAAFVVVYLLVEGWPPLPPVSAKQKLLWLALAGASLGCLVAGRKRTGALERALLVLLPAVGLLWLGERQWLRGPETGFVVVSVALWLAGAAILLRLRATDGAARGFATGAQVVIAAAGLSLIALAGASTSLATLAGALAAGPGGVLLIDYGLFLASGAPSGLGPVGRLAVAHSLVMLAAIAVLFSDDVSVLAVAILALVFVSGRIPLRLDRGLGVVARLTEPAWAAIRAVVPAAVAVGVALLQAKLTDYP